MPKARTGLGSQSRSVEGDGTEVPDTWILTQQAGFAAPVTSGRQNQRLLENEGILYASQSRGEQPFIEEKIQGQ